MSFSRLYYLLFVVVLGWQSPLASQAEAGLPRLYTGQVPSAAAEAYMTALRYPLLYPTPAVQRPTNEASVGGKQAPSLGSLLRQQAMPEAFFCKLELKIDKAAKMNCRFRLGSVDYVDYLEGKRPNY